MRGIKTRVSAKRWIRLSLIISCILAALYLFHTPILNSMARQLVYEDDIKPCDAIVVLAGDDTGDRLITGISLFKKGYGGYIVFWGGPVYWKITHAELFLGLLKEYGVSPEFAVWSEEKLLENSTRGEAEVNMKLLERKGAKSFILVTSNYHTARAREVYAPLARKHQMAMYVYPAQDSSIRIEGWWKDRESAKNILLEFEKTLWYKIFK